MSEQPSVRPDVAIGIDLGTTNSLIAVWKDGQAELIPNSLGKTTTPSAVSLDDDGTLLVGEAAAARRISHPHRTAVAFKRLLGSDHQHELGDGHRYSPTELSAMVLKSLKADAEQHLGHAIEEVVISVPAYFSDEQRKHTAFAAELAGLKAVRLINEPTAAAMAYGLHDQEERLSLIFDLGGGTFDVTLLEYDGPIIEVCASTGDNYLGGEDFTRAIVDACLATWELKDSELEPAALARLTAQAEQLKCQPPGQRGELRWHWQDRDYRWQFPEREGPWTPLLQRLRQPIEQALRDSKLDPGALDHVVLVGGATRLKEIQQLVTQLFGKLPLRHLDPDTVVALGAAAQAACRLQDAAVREVILTDVCPYTLGISTTMSVDDQYLGGLMSPIIERNTTIPASRESSYRTLHDNQSKIRIDIYQGERPRVADNIRIGELEVSVPKAPAGEEAVTVRFSYDIDGLLEVDVTVQSTGAQTSKLIDRSPNGLSDADRARSHERLQAIKIHPRQTMPNRTLRARLESAYAQALGETRDQIMHWLNQFDAVLERQDPDEIRDVRLALEDALTQLP
ncbi:MAG: molecular chaperone HscC [Pseudomonadales bacterium]|nr:molecular chaperone HscC [Pseudomonadales bacterium]